MNIWAWVEKVQEDLRAGGRERLAELIDLVPQYMSDNLHEQLDAVMPEALALAREAKNAWVEVFLRHWYLQSTVLQRYLVRDYLPEAVSLIEFANREETRDCPQSICTTQDLANCYAHVDGPGYAGERLAVAEETLKRINAEWPCYTCISGEYATALLDAGRAPDALSFIERQRSELVRIGRSDRQDDMCGTHIDALISLGRLEEALALNERTTDLIRGESFVEFRRLDQARILARLGRHDEAGKHLLPFEVVLRTQSQYEAYADAAFHLASAGAIPNDWRLHGELEQLHRAMGKNGVLRRAIQIAKLQAKLAVARGRPESADRSARTIERLIGELRTPLGAPEELAALRRSIAEARARREGGGPSLAETAEATLEGLGEDPETDLATLEAAHARWPEHEMTTLALANALGALGDFGAALEHLRAHAGRDAGALDVVLATAHMLRDHGAPGELDAFAADVRARATDPEAIARCLWALALRDHRRGDRRSARARLEEILAARPEATNTRALLAEIERESENFEAALGHLDVLVAAAEEPGSLDWDRMVVATILGRWDKVRHSAARLGMEIPGEGPIALAGGELVRIRFGEASGDTVDFFATRTGPVTATVVEIAHPGLVQHFRDKVVFEARPENDPPETGEEEFHTFIYPAVCVLEPGDYRSFVLDGVHPGDAAVAEMRAALDELGGRFELRSDESYRVEPPGEDERETLTGLYAFVAIPSGASPSPLRDALRRIVGEAEHPLIWPGLAEALGDEEELEAHRAIAERYGL